jgi:hypothetical protein
MNSKVFAHVAEKFGPEHAAKLRQLDATADRPSLVEYLKTLFQQRPTPWRETIDYRLSKTVEWLRNPPPLTKRRGNPSPLAKQFFRFCCGRMVIDDIRQQESLRENEASRRVARHILKSAIVQRLTIDERRLLNIPEGTSPFDIKALALTLRKGSK